jgi:hypothetical protein
MHQPGDDMPRPKRRVDGEGEDQEIFFDHEFDADEFVDTMTGDDTGSRRSRRPARQRVELRSEEKWLRQQLSDWDDLEEERE